MLWWLRRWKISISGGSQAGNWWLPRRIIFNPEYRPLTRKISDEREALQTKLNAEDSERLETLGEMYIETSSMYGYENFLCGFKLGASLMLEILNGEDGA